jgi:hypothetical protein
MDLADSSTAAQKVGRPPRTHLEVEIPITASYQSGRPHVGLLFFPGHRSFQVAQFRLQSQLGRRYVGPNLYIVGHA